MLLSFKSFSGIRPRLNPFGVPSHGASSCQNVVFENGCIVPMLDNVLPINDAGSRFEPTIGDLDPTSPGSGVIGWESDFPVVTKIVKPNYVSQITGSQTVFYRVNYKYSTFRKVDSTTSSYITSHVTRERSGYRFSILPGPNPFKNGDLKVTYKPYVFNVVNKIEMDGTPMYIRSTAAETDPSFPVYSVEKISLTNGKPIQLKIAGGQNAFTAKNDNNWAHPSDDGKNYHVAVDGFISVSETYTRSDFMQFKIAILDHNLEIISISKASSLEYMDVGDGAHIIIPVVYADGVKIPTSRIKVFRSLNKGPFFEIEIPKEDFKHVIDF